MEPNSSNGVVTVSSPHSVEATVAKMEELLAAKGIKLFALVDHSGEAERAGIRMRPTKLLIFGNPKTGSPLMIASPSAALDLPLKLLVAEDADGRVAISYNSATYLESRHGLPHDLAQVLSAAEMIAAKAAE